MCRDYRRSARRLLTFFQLLDALERDLELKRMQKRRRIVEDRDIRQLNLGHDRAGRSVTRTADPPRCRKALLPPANDRTFVRSRVFVRSS